MNNFARMFRDRKNIALLSKGIMSYVSQLRSALSAGEDNGEALAAFSTNMFKKSTKARNAGAPCFTLENLTAAGAADVIRTKALADATGANAKLVSLFNSGCVSEQTLRVHVVESIERLASTLGIEPADVLKLLTDAMHREVWMLVAQRVYGAETTAEDGMWLSLLCDMTKEVGKGLFATLMFVLYTEALFTPEKPPVTEIAQPVSVEAVIPVMQTPVAPVIPVMETLGLPEAAPVVAPSTVDCTMDDIKAYVQANSDKFTAAIPDVFQK